MAAKIFWFSGSGNSLAVAKSLAANLPNAELIPIARAVREPPGAADVMGIVCPVYAWGPPALVAEFVQKMKFQSGGYRFAVMTYAGSQGGAPLILRDLFRRRGADLDAVWTVKMPENFPPLGGAPSPEKQREANDLAEGEIRRIADELQLFPRGVYETYRAGRRTTGLEGTLRAVLCLFSLVSAAGGSVRFVFRSSSLSSSPYSLYGF
jgi:hypothetical protein